MRELNSRNSRSQLPHQTPAVSDRSLSRRSRAVTAVGVLESKTSIESSTCSPNALLHLVVTVTTAVTTAVADDGVRESAILRLRELAAGVELPQTPAARAAEGSTPALKKTPAAGAWRKRFGDSRAPGRGRGGWSLWPFYGERGSSHSGSSQRRSCQGSLPNRGSSQTRFAQRGSRQRGSFQR